MDGDLAAGYGSGITSILNYGYNYLSMPLLTLIEVKAWMNNYIQHKAMVVIIYTCPNDS